MKEIYKGSDVKKAYPKTEGFWVSTEDGKGFDDETYYTVKSTRYTPTFFEVEFEKLKIWEGKR